MASLYEAFSDLADARDERDEDARRDAIDERRRRAQMNHWCTECHGHTGPGSPCAIEPDPEDEPEDQPEEETS